MRIPGSYSFNKGLETVQERYAPLLKEIEQIIRKIDASICKTKTSKEKTMSGRLLYSPKVMNDAFRLLFYQKGWSSQRVTCEYSAEFYVNGYKPKPMGRGAFRQMDFVKDRLGVEVQFGAYACVGYDVLAKMPIFHNLGVIDIGVEIVPVKGFNYKMSTGGSSFEQCVWDLEKRGVSDIDVPVLILGIDK